MKKTRNSKRRAILEDFIQRIKDGKLADGDSFPTIGELCRSFRICPGTAMQLIHDLREMGLVDVARGRRSVVSIAFSARVRPILNKPIGIISPSTDFFQRFQWCERALLQLQRAILDHGNRSFWLPENFNPANGTELYSGFIFVGELVRPEILHTVQSCGLPWVRLCFDRPYPNSIYVDYRSVADQIALQIVKRGCRRIFYLSASEWENGITRMRTEKYGFNAILEAYGFRNGAYTAFTVGPIEKVNFSILREQVRETRVKIALLAGSSFYNNMVLEMMRELNREPGRDYEFLTLSSIPYETVVGPCVDIKCELIVEKILNLFYRQCETGKAQLAEIVYPELVLR